MRRSLLYCISLVLACAPSTGPEGEMSNAEADKTVAVRVNQEFVAATVIGTYVAVDLTISVVNRTESTLELVRCGTVLQRESAERNRDVWSSICSLGMSELPLEIPAGTERQIDISIKATQGQGTSTEWQGPIDGGYRVRVFLIDATRQKALSKEAGISNVFQLRARSG